MSMTSNLGTNEVYDPQTDKWETLEDMPTATKTCDIPIRAAKIMSPIPSMSGIVNTKPGWEDLMLNLVMNNNF